jgi:NAD(P)-dependent dehydrogenase (short-subunit alcohol dehydrogenase family)
MSTLPKAVLITGASKRLGLLFARRCVDLGFKAVLHCRTTHDELEKLLSEDARYKDNIFLVHQELTDHPETLINSVAALPLALTGLINNASIFTEGNLCDHNHFQEILTINALIPLRLSTAFYNTIKKGWIVNITDAMCTHSNIRFQNYRLSKHILELITKQSALLFAPDVRVNGIAPGAMLPAPDEQNYFSTLEKTVPLQRTGDTESLLKALSFIIETPYLTGEIIRVDGGWNLKN